MNGRGPKTTRCLRGLAKDYHGDSPLKQVLGSPSSKQVIQLNVTCESQPAINYFGSPFHSLTIPCQKRHHPRIGWAQLPKMNIKWITTIHPCSNKPSLWTSWFSNKNPRHLSPTNFHSDPLKTSNQVTSGLGFLLFLALEEDGLPVLRLSVIWGCFCPQHCWQDLGLPGWRGLRVQAPQTMPQQQGIQVERVARPMD